MSAERELEELASNFQKSNPNLSRSEAIGMATKYIIDEELIDEDAPILSDEPEICNKLTDRQRYICRLRVAGIQVKNIAKILGMTKEHCSVTSNSVPAKAYMQYLRGKVDDKLTSTGLAIRDAAPLAFNKLIDILEDDEASKSLQVKCAFDLLDRAGFKPPETINLNNQSDITPEDLKGVKGLDKDLAYVFEQSGEAGVSPGSEQEPPTLGEGISP